MRHNKSFNHLGRKVGHRKAMLSNMASSLILHKRIKTTTAKAKALRTYIEPLITKTKGLTTVEEKTHAQRVVFSYLKDKYAVKELFGEIADKVANRPGGYTRILKTGTRLGDNADMCFIELVDYNENMLTDQETKKTSSRRSRRGGKKKTDETQSQSTKAQAAETNDSTANETEVTQETTEQVSAEAKVDDKSKEAQSTSEKTKAEATEEDNKKEDEKE